ncbi:hypothetical protein DASC09_037890 [Saccharomycopsis crataegensis]|uniref:Rab-GAP TBC domain-containing protein n=1 Tax=Saccharomycopsis crataegensis TaxID=43959 RepID=A0AAV5QPW1_9ASCO|nr:hypothetical protein DASC09_037890 [Saccharomycopsis crataegensis]
MPPSNQNGSTPASGDDFALKSFVTRNRSLARRSVHGPPKGLFNLSGSGISENQTSESNPPSQAPGKPKRPVSIISGIDTSQIMSQGPPSASSSRGRPISMISMSSAGTSTSNYNVAARNPFKIDLMLDNDASTTSIASSSNSQSFNQNVLRNNYSAVDKKIFNTPQMLYSPDPANGASNGAHNATQTLNLAPSFNVNPNNGTILAEKKFNLGNVTKSSPNLEKNNQPNDLEYRTNVRSIHRQFNINKFNISLKSDLFRDFKSGKQQLLKQLDKIHESYMINSKTPVVNQFTIKKLQSDDVQDIDWEFWKSVVDHYPTKMTNVRSLKRVETVFSTSGIPSSVRPLIYLYLTNSKTATLEKIYKENTVISFFSKENDLRLRICETFNTELRCLKSDQYLFEISDLNKELLQKVDKDLFEILRNFTIYYDRGGYAEIKGLLSPDNSPSVNNAINNDEPNANSFYLPSKAIVSVCALLLRSCGVEDGVFDIKTSDSRLTKAEIFGLLVMLNENYFCFDNEINARNLRILKKRKKNSATDKAAAIVAGYNSAAASGASSRRSSITVDSGLIMAKAQISRQESELNNIKYHYTSDHNKDKFIYIFNRSMEDLFPEVFLYLSSKGIHTNILLERFVFEFFHRFSTSYKLYDNENQDEKNIPKEEDSDIEEQNLSNSSASPPKSKANKTVKINDIELNNTEFETIRASVNNDLSIDSINEIKGDLDAEVNNKFFSNGYKLSNENLLRILDMVMIQGVEFLIKFLLLVIEKNYFKIFKIKNNQVLMKFLSSNVVFNFIREENIKFVTKKIYESELDKYEDINSYSNPNRLVEDELSKPESEMAENNSNKLDIKSLAKGTTVRSDLRKSNLGNSQNPKSEKLIDITIKEKKTFGDFIVESLKFEPVIYKYEEELKMLEKERRAMESGANTGIGIYKNKRANNSETSIASTLTSNFGDDGAIQFSRNSSSSSLSDPSLSMEDLETPELIDLRAEKKDNKVRLMKLQTDLNNLSLTHKTYKREILLKNEHLNKIKNLNLELKMKKEELERNFNDLKLKEELYHSVLRNIKIDEMNNEVKSQIEHSSADIRDVIEKTDKIKADMVKINETHKTSKSNKSSPVAKTAASFFSGFGFGR